MLFATMQLIQMDSYRHCTEELCVFVFAQEREREKMC